MHPRDAVKLLIDTTEHTAARLTEHGILPNQAHQMAAHGTFAHFLRARPDILDAVQAATAADVESACADETPADPADLPEVHVAPAPPF